MSTKHKSGDRVIFETRQGKQIPSVSTDEMREVDRLAEEVFSLSVLQMMENAGRNLALHAMQLCQKPQSILVLAGSGGNGGGGLACMRHLHNHGFRVDLLMTQNPDQLSGPARSQYKVLEAAGLSAQPLSSIEALLSDASLVIDAILGYSLRGAPRGVAKDLIQALDTSTLPTLSLDLPSGLDATTGETPGVSITPTRTLTLALPKHGLINSSGELFLADIGIPFNLYEQIGLRLDPIFFGQHWIELFPPDTKS